MTSLAGSWAGSRRTSALYRHLPSRPGAPHCRGTACTTSRRRFTRSATPGVQMQPDTQTAVADARAANDFLAAVIGEHPGRFQGLAAVPLQDPRQAAAELRRAVRELGLRDALVNDHTLGRYLDEPRFEPFWEMRQDLGVALYIHPNPVSASEWTVVQGHPGVDFGTWVCSPTSH